MIKKKKQKTSGWSTHITILACHRHLIWLAQALVQLHSISWWLKVENCFSHTLLQILPGSVCRLGIVIVAHIHSLEGGSGVKLSPAALSSCNKIMRYKKLSYQTQYSKVYYPASWAMKITVGQPWGYSMDNFFLHSGLELVDGISNY